MPHIFPRRFLRTRDLVSPEGLNDDIHPVYDALSGRLDRTNFSDSNLKAKLRPHPDSALPVDTGASVSQGAYYNIHTSQIESKYRFYTTRTSDDYGPHQPNRVPPNFVKLDGATTRWTHNGGGAPFYDDPPSVVPNNGAWEAVRNEDLSGPQQLTFTTGQSRIWISAYLQYIWQGFYEYKSPYIPGSRKFKGVEALNIPEPGESYLIKVDETGLSASYNKFLAFDERQILNFLGPASIHEHLPDSETVNLTENIVTSSAEYAFPLNEMPVYQERTRPNRCGFHHISQGFYPCLVQFALRVDGKIIEETITGKKLPFEESAHGLTVTDSVRIKEPDEEDSDESVLREFLPFFTTDNTVFGQRSATVASAYGDSDDSRPGQKVKSSRAVSCGPEVMPVRIGAVVEVQPGTHTIEIVARRLQRKAGKFLAGDFVGVFSRRILAFDLPVTSQRNDLNYDKLAKTAVVGGTSVIEDIPSFKTEDLLTRENISASRQTLANEINNLTEQNLDTEIFSHEYLPSKVTFHRSITVRPQLHVNKISGEYGDVDNEAFSQAIFAGFTNPRIDSEVTSNLDGWTRPGAWLASDRAGWYPIQAAPGSSTSATDDGEILKINTSQTTDKYPEGFLLRPNEVVIAMMDVELRGIEPLNSEAADRVYGAVDLLTDGTVAAAQWRNFGNYLLTERYLDLFALFAIGYVVDGTRIIASQSTPALVNSYNWVNRTAFFNSGPRAVIPFSASSAHRQEPWDINPGWEYFSEDERRALFNNDYAGETPRLLSRGGNLAHSNLGITVPIMQVIENKTGVDQVISEYAGYVSTMVPSDWTDGYDPDFPRKIVRADGSWFTLPGQWASPKNGRNILSGCRVHFGNSRLTIIKTWK